MSPATDAIAQDVEPRPPVALVIHGGAGFVPSDCWGSSLMMLQRHRDRLRPRRLP